MTAAHLHGVLPSSAVQCYPHTFVTDLLMRDWQGAKGRPTIVGVHLCSSARKLRFRRLPSKGWVTQGRPSSVGHTREPAIGQGRRGHRQLGAFRIFNLLNERTCPLVLLLAGARLLACGALTVPHLPTWPTSMWTPHKGLMDCN